MKRILFVFAVISSLVVTSSSFAAQAGAARQSVGAARKGPVGKLIELERRKNEWLRQRFGR
jgi:hypothetical protein